MILLSTVNATYFHTALGLRYLYANLNELQLQAKILEFTHQQKVRDIVDTILSHSPKIVGFSVYIWNTQITEEIVSTLKNRAPHILVVLGGPEVSYETETQSICKLADITIQGEGDIAFYQICRDYLLSGIRPPSPIYKFPLPQLQKVKSPYPYYAEEDIQRRVIYVEASRGCAFKCEFCLSALDESVRNFPLDAFLSDLNTLISRGAKQFKFVDRTFNLKIATSQKILTFFLERINRGLFLHFEMIPDRLPEALRGLIQQFPKGSLQFEVGIQTWNEDVSRNISRKQHYASVVDNLTFLRTKTHAHLHTDLIVGLPGETLASFAAGFNKLHSLRPHEIQVGILKRLKGTPIIRHEGSYQMIYEDHPPFSILENNTMAAHEILHMKRFAKFWDLYANSGRFPQYLAALESYSLNRNPASMFDEFSNFVSFLSTRHPQTFGIPLEKLTESAWVYLIDTLGFGCENARSILLEDYCQKGMRDVPKFLRTDTLPARPFSRQVNPSSTHTPLRQQRFL